MRNHIAVLRRSTLVWAVLMIVSIATTWGLSTDWFPAEIATAGILVLAAWKVRLVMFEFMELRHAPRLPRAPFEAWAIIVPAAMIVAFALA
jgi:heme/copper-type cytochrome/quinol oxidase subunit 4